MPAAMARALAGVTVCLLVGCGDDDSNNDGGDFADDDSAPVVPGIGSNDSVGGDPGSTNEPPEQERPVRGRDRPPGRERRLRACDGGVRLLHARLLELGERLLGRGIDHGERHRPYLNPQRSTAQADDRSVASSVRSTSAG